MIRHVLAVGWLLVAGAVAWAQSAPSADPHPDRLLVWLDQLKNGTKPEQRSAAAHALARYPDRDFPEVTPALVEALRGDASPTVRKEIVRLLGERKPGTAEVKETLEQVARRDPVWSVRQASRWARLGYRITPAPQATAKATPPSPPSAKTPAGFAAPPRAGQRPNTSAAPVSADGYAPLPPPPSATATPAAATGTEPAPILAAPPRPR